MLLKGSIARLSLLASTPAVERRSQDLPLFCAITATGIADDKEYSTQQTARNAQRRQRGTRHTPVSTRHLPEPRTQHAAIIRLTIDLSKSSSRLCTAIRAACGEKKIGRRTVQHVGCVALVARGVCNSEIGCILSSTWPTPVHNVVPASEHQVSLRVGHG